MANYTTEDIKVLRERTGAGMMDVKKALDEANGDHDKAIEIIRVKGLAGIAKREGRAATDGLVAAEIIESAEGQTGIMVEVNAETDFVVKNEKFMTLADKVLAAAVASGATTAEELLAAPVADSGRTVADEVNETSAILGEKLVVRRVARVSGPLVTVYLHKVSRDLPPQVGVLIATDEAGADVAKDVAMHIAAYSPSFLTREDVPAETVENERRIAEETARNEGKPEQAMPKIVEGRLTGYFKENVLVEQAYARDAKTTVGKVLAEAKATVLDFARFKVGV